MFDDPELSALGQGRLEITVKVKERKDASKGGGPSTSLIKGTLGPKISCDIFDCVMADSATDVQSGKTIYTITALHYHCSLGLLCSSGNQFGF